ncbi:MAG: hypothetical protein IT168_01345 [Bryobacterales bacterium]|nr:hypothetical protein [Bryobacterales bacterium]
MPGVTRTMAAVTGLLLVTIGAAAAQTSAVEPSGSIEELKRELQDLRRAVAEVRSELKRSAEESAELRREVSTLRARLEPAAARPGVAAIVPEIAAIREEQQVLNAKVEEQHQAKVASGSRYRVKLSGMALMNVVGTRGEGDNMDVPFVAETKPAGGYKGSFGATVRQSTLGLQVSGPTVWGARTSGEVRFDFFGGFPDTPDGVTAGLMRMRTASLTLDWDKTTVVAGQEAPFFSPLAPTSFATVGYPSLSYAGNLWTWTPQVYAEHRFNAPGRSTLLVQGGFLDALTGDTPVSEYERVATAGERSRMPAFASRVGWRRGEGSDRTEIGVSGYYSRQNWGFSRNANGWAGTLDWTVPLSDRFTFSGEFYRGNAISGLGGGAAPSVLLLEPSRGERSGIHTVASAGGWSQVKFKALATVEFNAAIGQDQALRLGKLQWDQAQNPVRRNLSGFLNVIYQPRSNLLFSVEYRRLRTIRVVDGISNAGHINIGAGILF